MSALATGPRTPEGKARSSKNATRHGLLSRDLLQGGEKPAHLDGLSERLRAQLEPEGELELLLVERVVSCVWRLRRALRVEVELLESSRWSSSTGEDYGPYIGWIQKRDTLTVLNRYEVTLERSLFKALHELERLQAARRGERVPLPAVLDVAVSGHSDG